MKFAEKKEKYVIFSVASLMEGSLVHYALENGHQKCYFSHCCE